MGSRWGAWPCTCAPTPGCWGGPGRDDARRARAAALERRRPGRWPEQNVEVRAAARARRRLRLSDSQSARGRGGAPRRARSPPGPPGPAARAAPGGLPWRMADADLTLQELRRTRRGRWWCGPSLQRPQEVMDALLLLPLYALWPRAGRWSSTRQRPWEWYELRAIDARFGDAGGAGVFVRLPGAGSLTYAGNDAHGSSRGWLLLIVDLHADGEDDITLMRRGGDEMDELARGPGLPGGADTRGGPGRKRPGAIRQCSAYGTPWNPLHARLPEETWPQLGNAGATSRNDGDQGQQGGCSPGNSECWGCRSPAGSTGSIRYDTGCSTLPARHATGRGGGGACGCGGGTTLPRGSSGTAKSTAGRGAGLAGGAGAHGLDRPAGLAGRGTGGPDDK